MSTAAPRPAAPAPASFSPTCKQRLFSSIAAFDRTLTTHRKTLLRKREAEEAGVEPELLDDDDAIDAATEGARGEIGDLDHAIAHVDRMLAVGRAARDLPDARVAALLDWIEAEMLAPRRPSLAGAAVDPLHRMG